MSSSLTPDIYLMSLKVFGAYCVTVTFLSSFIDCKFYFINCFASFSLIDIDLLNDGSNELLIDFVIVVTFSLNVLKDRREPLLSDLVVLRSSSRVSCTMIFESAS